MYGYIWLYMAIYGYIWLYMAIYGYYLQSYHLLLITTDNQQQ